MTQCAVCGNPVDPTSAPSYEYNGTTYYFRCNGCLGRFKANPTQFLEGGPQGCGHKEHGNGKHNCH